MDPASLAAAAVGLLVTYLGRLGTKVAGQAADELDEVVLGRLRRLFEVIKQRVGGPSYAGGALERVEAQPENERRQAALEDALTEIVQADREFAAQLSTLVDEVRATGGEAVRISDTGVVSLGGKVVMRGRFVAGRDLNVGEPKPEPGG